MKDHFDDIFKGTFIHDNPTRERSSYLILSLNFSEINPELHRVDESFEDHILTATELFCDTYRGLLGKDIQSRLENKSKSYYKLSFLFKHLKMKGLKCYLIIDEYDNFANTILTSSSKEEYLKLTHGAGLSMTAFLLRVGRA